LKSESQIAESARSEAIHSLLLTKARGRHPRLANVISGNGVLSAGNKQTECIVRFLARIVVGQQLSSVAARSIWNRVCALAKVHSCNVTDLFEERYVTEIQSCGVSASKARAMIMMRHAFDHGDLAGTQLNAASYEEIVKQVTALWGFGAWSADMVAIFFVQLPDVWPTSDAALIRGMKLLAPGEAIEGVVADYRPYRSYLARHVWYGLDSGKISG